MEDNGFSMQGFQDYLRTLDINYEMASSAEDSVSIFRDTLNEGYLFDCVFMKLIMPGMSGFDAAKEFRKLETEFGLNSDTRHFICGITAEISDRKYRLFFIRFRIKEEVRRDWHRPSSLKADRYQ